jgi:hypothetical protein
MNFLAPSLEPDNCSVVMTRKNASSLLVAHWSLRQRPSSPYMGGLMSLSLQTKFFFVSSF